MCNTCTSTAMCVWGKATGLIHRYNMKHTSHICTRTSSLYAIDANRRAFEPVSPSGFSRRTRQTVNPIHIETGDRMPVRPAPAQWKNKCAYERVYTWVLACVRACACACACACVCVRVCVCERMCLCVHLCVYACACTCTCTCTHVS